jgi:acyl-CoA thioester hydrolase
MFFVSRGFDVAEFARLKLGPVVKSDQVRYFREVGLLANLRATLALGGSSADGSRFQMRNEFFRDDGQLAAQIDTVGGWLDIATRRLTAPTAAILEALGTLARTEDFAVLPSSLRP